MSGKFDTMSCQECGYDMHDREHRDICPECGTGFDKRRKIPYGDRYSKLAILFICIGIITFPIIGLIPSLIFFGTGCVFSCKILRKTTYHSTPYHLTKRMKIISVLMWVYGLEIIALYAAAYILYLMVT